MIDLSTKYLGLTLRNPLVVSASPLTEDIDNVRRMEEAGAAAVVMHSLFEEQIRRESTELNENLSHGTESFAESLTYFPDLTNYNLGPEGYLKQVARAKAAVAIPIIGSLNGSSTGGWIQYAKKIQDAGADALELNIYFIAADPEETGMQVEQRYVDLVQNVAAAVKIPVAVKIGSAFSSMANIARRLDAAGARGLVLFNRFYQPDFDLENLEVQPSLSLSEPCELLLRLRWTAILFPHVRADIAVTGGVHSATDVIKAMMAGARVAMMTSALLKNGIQHVAKVHADVLRWMEEHEYSSIAQMQGSMSQRSVPDPTALERANYVKVLSSYSTRPRRV